MAWLALGLTIAGLGYAFGLRSYLAWRATGDTGLRTHVGPVRSVAWWAKLLFLTAIVLLLAGPATTLVGWPAMTWQTGVAVQAVGVVLAVAGMLIVATAQHGMGSSWRIGVDTSETTGLVTGGLFALARNPIFTGMIAFAAGIALIAPGLVSAAAVAVLLIAIQMQVRAVEEPYLLHTHGDAYRRYAAHTGRFLPGIGRLHGTTSAQWASPRQP